MSKCNVCGKEMRAGTEHVRPDLATVCSSCAKRPFDYQQWRTASVVTPKMLDSCLDCIAELETQVADLSSLCDRLTAVNQSRVNDEAVALKRAKQAEADLAKVEWMLNEAVRQYCGLVDAEYRGRLEGESNEDFVAETLAALERHWAEKENEK